MVEFWKFENGAGTRLFSLDSARAEKLLAVVTEWVEGAKGVRSRPVYVEAVDEVEYSAWRERGAESLSELPASNEFPSALAASLFIGCKSNQVATALKLARDKGERFGVVRGMKFCYVADLRD